MARDERYAARKDYIKKWARERYQKRGNKCAYCWKPHPGPRSYCEECNQRIREKRAARTRAQRLKRKEAGLCQRCGGTLDHGKKEGDFGMDVSSINGRKLLTCFACRSDNQKYSNARSY